MGLNKQKASLALTFLSFLWGATFALNKIGLEFAKTPEVLYFLRFTIAFIILAFFYIGSLNTKISIKGLLKKITDKKLFIHMLATAIAGHIAYFFQVKSLNQISANYAAFTSGLAVVFVPVFLFLFNGRKVAKNEVLGVVIGVCGLLLISGFSGGAFNQNDLYLLISTVFFSFHLILMGSKQVEFFGHWEFALTQTFLMASFAFANLSWDTGSLDFLKNSGPDILFNGAVTFILGIIVFVTFYIQSRFQNRIGSLKSALIFSTEPVFAAVISYLLLDEKATISTIIGGLLILLSTIVPELQNIRFFKIGASHER